MVTFVAILPPSETWHSRRQLLEKLQIEPKRSLFLHMFLHIYIDLSSSISLKPLWKIRQKMLQRFSLWSFSEGSRQPKFVDSQVPNGC